MKFRPKLNLGDYITNEELINIFKCGNSGGMRRSLRTKSLVLISDHTTNTYKNAYKNRDGIWEFQGMGLTGDQDLNYRYNQTLLKSNEEDISIYLFIKLESNMYRYEGQHIVIDYPKSHFSEIENRKIVIYKLFHVHQKENITDFLISFKKSQLINLGILNSSNLYLSSKNVDGLIKLMREKNKEILFGQDGWFISKDGFYYNSHSKEKWGNVFDVSLEEKGIFINQNKYINPYFKNSLVQHSSKNKENLNEDGNATFLISILEFTVENKNYKLELSKHNSSENVNDLFYSSVIIGKNGIGKSLVLSTIEKIFLDLHSLSNSGEAKETRNIDFEISYICNFREFTITRKKTVFEFYEVQKHGKRFSVGLNDLALPESLISCAFSIQDKFSGTKSLKISSDYYQYLGIRNNGSRNINRMLANNIKSAILSNVDFLRNFKIITDFLEFEPEVKLQYKLKKINIDKIYDEDFLIKKINKNRLKNNKNIYFQDIIRFYEKIERKVNDDNTFNFLNHSVEIHLNCHSAETYTFQYEDFELLNAQIELGLFEEPQLMVKKNREWVSINQVSSGEFQVLSTMINILCKVKDNSLIIIDEPETSLHPNWQIKYMSMLSLIFKNYSNCHFIIATHSHFFVSDLEVQKTCLIQIKKKMTNICILKS